MQIVIIRHKLPNKDKCYPVKEKGEHGFITLKKGSKGSLQSSS